MFTAPGFICRGANKTQWSNFLLPIQLYRIVVFLWIYLHCLANVSPYSPLSSVSDCILQSEGGSLDCRYRLQNNVLANDLPSFRCLMRHCSKWGVVVGMVINPMRESIPFTKAPDQGVGMLMWSASPTVSYHYLPHICTYHTLGWASNLGPSNRMWMLYWAIQAQM